MKSFTKKYLSLALSLMMMLSLAAPFSNVVNARDMSIENSNIYLTKKGKMAITVTFKSNVDAKDLEWTLDGKPLTEWKSFNEKAEKYDGEPWLKIENVKVDGNKVTAELVNTLPYGVESVDKRPYPRWTFMSLIGEHNLKATNKANNETEDAEVKISAYEGFYTYDELKPALDKIIAEGNSKNDRFIEYQSFGKTVEGRDLHAVIIAKDKASIDKYLDYTKVQAMENPSKLIEEIKSGKLKDYKVPIMISTPHPDEHPAVDSQMRTIKELCTKDNIKFRTDEKDEKKTADLNMKDVLDNFIIIFNLTENPDGRYHNLRHNANGFDLNRDNIYQVQPEAIELTEQMAKWHPLMFLDLHGFVKEFLIEPCTPPHEPNFEYDLLMGGKRIPGATKDTSYGVGAIENAKNMGNTAIANTKYDSFIIPLYDYGSGWDDAFLGYTGVFSMIHGALGHTIEIPESNVDSVKAHEHTILAAINYALHNKQQLFLNQLAIYERGVKNEDNRNVDTWHVDPNGKQINRPRGNNENFFPEYYILPMDSEQSNKLEVYKMINYFIRNGIKVEKSTQEVTYKGVKYPAGSYVIPMHQAERGYANMTLYDGVDQSDWDAMYAEVVLNFPALKGFTKVEVREKGLFDNKTSVVKDYVTIPGTEVNVNTEKLVIKNDNIDAVKAVNNLMNDGKVVYTVTKASDNVNEGDFVVNTSDFKNIAKDYYVNILPDEGNLEVKENVMPKIYITPSGSNYSSLTDHTRWVLKQLGFNLVDSLETANTIVDSSGQISAKDIKGKNYVAVGGEALRAVQEKNIYPVVTQYNKDGESNEGLLKANYAKDSVITGSYKPDDIAYIASGTVIKSVPKTAKIIGKVADVKDFYTAGWWPNHEFVKGKTLAVTDKLDNSNIVLFAEDLTNKGYTTHLFRLLSSAVYAVNNDTSYDTDGFENQIIIGDLNNHWAEKTIKNLIDKNIINGYPDGTFKPNNNITRAEFVKIIVNAFKLQSDKKIDFKDVENSWAKSYIETAAGLGIVNGYNENSFGPNNNITREEMAKIIAKVLKLSEKEALKFSDKDKIAKWAVDSVEETVKAGIIKGYPDNEFKPEGKATRAEAATIIERSMNYKK